MMWILLALTLGLPMHTQATPQEGTAVVRGRITDAQTGTGIGNAVVTLHVRRTNRRLEALANREGFYEVQGLPAGLVSVEASAGEYSATHVTGRFTTETAAGGRATVVVLRDGEVRDGVDIALARSLAIGGLVVDDAGAPLANLSVRPFRAPGGQPVTGVRSQTDDRGAFRLFGLTPGRYFVCADPSGTGVPFGSGLPPGGDRRREPVPACHPSATGGDMGAAVAVGRSDVRGVTIVAPRRATLTMSGVVLDADGKPASASVSLRLDQKTAAGGISKTTGEGGTFTITDVSPGPYVLSAATMSRGEPVPAGDPQYVEMELTLDVDDLEDLVLLMRRPVRVKGRVVFDGGSPPDGAQGVAVRADGRMRGEASRVQSPPGAVDSDFRFELVNLFGPQVVAVSNLPRGWIVKAVRFRGADITDLPTEFRAGSDEVEIELTARGAILTGTVTDSSGNPPVPGRVVMFPPDPARWHPDVLRRAAPIARDGRFSMPARRAGDYLIVALSEEDYDGLGDAPSYELLEKVADRVTLLDDDRRVMNLRMTAVPTDDGRR